jgi:hypothetical protein
MKEEKTQRKNEGEGGWVRRSEGRRAKGEGRRVGRWDGGERRWQWPQVRERKVPRLLNYGAGRVRVCGTNVKRSVAAAAATTTASDRTSTRERERERERERVSE